MDQLPLRENIDVKTSPRLHARSSRVSLRAAQSDENGAPTANQQQSTRNKRSTNFSALPPRICDNDALRKISKLYERDPKRYNTLYHSVFLKEPTYDRFEAELSRIYSNSSRWDVLNNPMVYNRIASIRTRMANVAVKHQKKQIRRTQILREMADKKIARWELKHKLVYSSNSSLASSTSSVSCQTTDSEPCDDHSPASTEIAAIKDTRALQQTPPVKVPQQEIKNHSSISTQTQMEDPLVEQLRERVRYLEQINERLEKIVDLQVEQAEQQLNQRAKKKTKSFFSVFKYHE